MAYEMSGTINLRKLEYSPLANPLLEPTEVTVKKRYVKTGTSEELVSTRTGEIRQTAAIYTVDERDDASFVKVFAAGVAAAFDLGRTASRVFQLVLQEYERAPMRQGFAESIELAWFNDGLSGRSVDMSEKTFQRGLKELFGSILPCFSKATESNSLPNTVRKVLEHRPSRPRPRLKRRR
jgi:hypothetical protein